MDAERSAAELLKADPHHAGALYVLGCALTMQGRAGEAIAPLEAASGDRHNPECDTVLISLADEIAIFVAATVICLVERAIYSRFRNLDPAASLLSVSPK